MENKKSLSSKECFLLKTNGKKYVHLPFIFFYQKSDRCRVAFSLKKKFFSSVERVQIKRIIRAFLREKKISLDLLIIIQQKVFVKNKEDKINFRNYLNHFYEKTC